jgi:hypothetical protein
MRQVGTYFGSWGDNVTKIVAKHTLCLINKPVTHVYLAFCKPDLVYKRGSYTFEGTGLQFNSSFEMIRQAIMVLETRGIVVMLSVGGGKYWDKPKIKYNAQQCVDLMRDLGCSGIDIDWEVGVKHSQELVEAIKRTHVLLCAEYLTFSGFSTGAHDKNEFDKYKGMSIPALEQCPDYLDWVNIMAYDAGLKYDYRNSITNYKKYFPMKPIVFGYCIGKQGWGDFRNTQEYLNRSMFFLKTKDAKDGIFTWHFLKDKGFEKIDAPYIHNQFVGNKV